MPSLRKWSKRARSDDSNVERYSEQGSRNRRSGKASGNRSRSETRPTRSGRSRSTTRSRRRRPVAESGSSSPESRNRRTQSSKRGASSRDRGSRRPREANRYGLQAKDTGRQGRSGDRARGGDCVVHSNDFANQIMSYFDITEELHARALRQGKLVPIDKDGSVTARVFETNGTTVTAVEVKHPRQMSRGRSVGAASRSRDRRYASEVSEPRRSRSVHRAIQAKGPGEPVSAVDASKRMVVNVPSRWSSVDIRIQRTRSPWQSPVIQPSEPEKHVCTCPPPAAKPNVRQKRSAMVKPYSPFGLEQTYSEVEYHTGLVGCGPNRYTTPRAATGYTYSGSRPPDSMDGRNISISWEPSGIGHSDIPRHRIFGGHSACCIHPLLSRGSDYYLDAKDDLEKDLDVIRSKASVRCHERPRDPSIDHRDE